MEKFPIIKISGNAEERGKQHGYHLKKRIHKTIEFYHKVFNKTEEEIFSKAKHFANKIHELNPDYAIEIEAIAQAAHVEKEWIYALNSRSEILTMFVNECTAVVVPEHGLLAQNWDWAEELEKLAVIMKITYPNGHHILMMTEPGIIGKIGLNSAGLGVSLNFLHSHGRLEGVPIHILLRCLLDQVDFENAATKIRELSGGQAGNIILANGNGQCINFEFANTELFEIETSNSLTHTNHYLKGTSLNRDKEYLASSLARYQRSLDFLDKVEEMGKTGIKLLLSDQNNSNLPICRPYVPDEDIGNTGTITTLIMDLKNLELSFTPGNPFEHDFSSYSLLS